MQEVSNKKYLLLDTVGERDFFGGTNEDAKRAVCGRRSEVRRKSQVVENCQLAS